MCAVGSSNGWRQLPPRRRRSSSCRGRAVLLSWTGTAQCFALLCSADEPLCIIPISPLLTLLLLLLTLPCAGCLRGRLLCRWRCMCRMPLTSSQKNGWCWAPRHVAACLPCLPLPVLQPLLGWLAPFACAYLHTRASLPALPSPALLAAPDRAAGPPLLRGRHKCSSDGAGGEEAP